MRQRVSAIGIHAECTCTSVTEYSAQAAASAVHFQPLALEYLQLWGLTGFQRDRRIPRKMHETLTNSFPSDRRRHLSSPLQ